MTGWNDARGTDERVRDDKPRRGTGRRRGWGTGIAEMWEKALSGRRALRLRAV